MKTLAFTEKNWERHARLNHVSSLTLRVLLSDGWLESDARMLLRKSDFFFGDSIDEDEEDLYDVNYKWLCQIRNWYFFLPNMERMFPLSCLQFLSLRRQMDWELTKEKPDVAIGKISNHTTFSAGHGRDVVGLQPGLLRLEYPTGETPK